MLVRSERQAGPRVVCDWICERDAARPTHACKPRACACVCVHACVYVFAFVFACGGAVCANMICINTTL